ncbi:MAG: hypothetical protein CMH55_08515 [Myxococcales bacterium]|nr:hypothetical protein [Myxococcales bacterium]
MICLEPGAANYPQPWRELAHGQPPSCWFVGHPLPPSPRVGIVGARAAPPAVRRGVEAYARQCVEAGETVVSGGAVGVDAAAHRGALPTGSVAVVPFGLEAGWVGQARLAVESVVGASGAVFCLSHSRNNAKARYVARNRLLAALCDRIVVAWAAPRGGTMHTVRFARELGIPVEAWWSPGDGPGNGGCRQIVASEGRKDHPLEAALRNTGGRLTDDLVKAWGQELHLTLLELELEGRVVRLAPRMYRLIT